MPGLVRCQSERDSLLVGRAFAGAVVGLIGVRVEGTGAPLALAVKALGFRVLRGMAMSPPD